MKSFILSLFILGWGVNCYAWSNANEIWLKPGFYANIEVKPSSDGKLIAATSYDNDIKIIDSETGKLKFIYSDQKVKKIHLLNFNNNNNNFIAIVQIDTFVTVTEWDIIKNVKVKELKLQKDYYPLTQFFISRDNKYIAAISSGSNLKIWNYTDSKYIKEFEKYNDTFTNFFEFSPDCKRFAMLKADKISIANLETTNLEMEINTFSYPSDKFTYNSLGNKICRFTDSYTDESQVTIYDLDSLKILKVFTILVVNSIKFTNDSETIIAVTHDGIKKINFLTGITICKISNGPSVDSFEFINDKEEEIVTGGNSIDLWSLKNCCFEKKLTIENPQFFNVDERYVVSLADRLLSIYNRASCDSVKRILLTENVNQNYNYIPNTNYFHCFDSNLNLNIYNIDSSKAIETFKFSSLNSFVYFSKDLKFCSQTQIPRVSLWNWESKKIILTIDSMIYGTFSSNSRFFTGYHLQNDSLFVYDLSLLKLVLKRSSKNYSPYCISNDEKYLYYLAKPDIINKIDIDNDSIIQEFKRDTTDGITINLIPLDNNTLIEAVSSGKIRILYLKENKTRTIYDKYPVNIRVLYLSNDKKNLLINYKDNTSVFLELPPDQVEEIQNNQPEYNIFPNPSTEFIEIHLDRWSPPSRWTPSDIAYIRIYNALGEIVSTPVCSADTPAGGGHIKIDVSSLPTGLYFVRVGDKIQKFVKL